MKNDIYSIQIPELIFELYDKSDEAYKICEPFQITKQGIVNEYLRIIEVKREQSFFKELFKNMEEEELLFCSDLIKTNLEERFNHDF